MTRFLTNVGLTGTGEDPSRTGTDPFKVLETQAQGLLYRVDLQGADLAGAFLPGVDLTFADLKGANLSGANLEGAVVTEEQLEAAKSLEGATMPDGSVHD